MIQTIEGRGLVHIKGVDVEIVVVGIADDRS
jgi:hypothetical protein